MFSLAFFLAKRFIQISEHKNSINVMIKICFWGIFISTFSLALVNAIMYGFEQATHKKLQGIHADLSISAQGKPLKYTAIATIIAQEFPTISACTPHSEAPAMIKTEHDTGLPNLISLTAIDPITEGSVTLLPTLIQQPLHVPLHTLLSNNGLLIGNELAQQLKISLGDPVDLLIATEEKSTNKALALEMHRAVVTGIFKTGIDEFDAHVAYCTHTFFGELFPAEGITTLLLKKKEGFDDKKLIAALRDRLHLSVYSWKDLYPALVSALLLEKYVMFIILALISLIATMNIVSLLFMYITQKKSEIALLKTVGITTTTLIGTFMVIGVSIACSAALLGIIFAAVASFLLEKYPFITLPDAYYVTHVPAHMTLTSACIIFLLVLILSIGATIIPIRKIKAISVPDVLKKGV